MLLLLLLNYYHRVVVVCLFGEKVWVGGGVVRRREGEAEGESVCIKSISNINILLILIIKNI